VADQTHRELAEHEARLDLRKPLVQLLADIHDELLRADRTPNENLVHAQKRIASLDVRVAQAADWQSRMMLALTVVLVILTLVMLWKM
jgi:hypothetical protein